MTDIVAFDNVVKRYPGGKLALDRVSLRLGRGEMAFLTGHSGAGKSTLMKLIGLIERPTRGRVVINGTDLARVRRVHIPRYRQRVGLIFQNYNLLHDRTVFDNVALPLVIRGTRPYRDRPASPRRTGYGRSAFAREEIPDHAVRRRTTARGYCAGGGQPPASAAGR